MKTIYAANHGVIPLMCHMTSKDLLKTWQKPLRAKQGPKNRTIFGVIESMQMCWRRSLLQWWRCCFCFNFDMDQNVNPW